VSFVVTVFCRDPRTEAAAFHHIYPAKLVSQKTSSTRSGPWIDSSSFVLTTSPLLVPFEEYFCPLFLAVQLDVIKIESSHRQTQRGNSEGREARKYGDGKPGPEERGD
jgi:hypothetical protein